MLSPDRRRGKALIAAFLLLIGMGSTRAEAQAPVSPGQLDPETLRRLQDQLGSGQTTGASEQLDASRANGLQMQSGANGQLSPGFRTGRDLTEEELEVLRVRSRFELERIEPASPIEREFRNRTGERSLRQFGYELFQSGPSGSGSLTGSLGGEYVLGVGDELIVSFRGATNRTQTARVDREGRVVVGELPPISAAGRSVGAVRSALNASARRTLLGTSVDVSVGTVRSISVFVGGEVARPGQYQVTSLADITAVLAQAGGVRKSGSLRSVRIVRAGGAVTTVDLYGLLGIGSPPAVRLREGDRVIVPVIGDTIAVSGGVARPGIYEVRGSVSVGAALDFAGGPVRQRGQDLAVSRIGPGGQEEYLRASRTTILLPGDALQVSAGTAGGAAGRVLLRGYVLDPGSRPLALAPTVRSLLGSIRDLRPDTYLAAAVRVTRDPVSGARRYETVDLYRALSGERDVALSDEDRLYVLSRDDIAFINQPAVRNIVLGQPNARPDCRGLTRLEELVRDTQSPRYTVVTRGAFQTSEGTVGTVAASLAQRSTVDATRRTRSATEANISASPQELAALGGRVPADPRLSTEARLAGDDPLLDDLRYPGQVSCPRVFQEEPELLPVLIENAISVGGSVRRPGAYPIARSASAETLSALAEGLLGNSSNLVLDVLRNQNGQAVQSRVPGAADAAVPSIVLQPGDDVRFTAILPQFEPGAVLLSGEVARPGLYVIRKGERLSELLARAGGLTSLAYPYGAVFTRRGVREQEAEGFRRTARELNEALLAVTARRTTSSGDGLAAAGEFIRNLSNVQPQGRVVVEADPRVLKLRPDLDTVLEAGDSVLFPKLPTYVLALGDISNPGALQFIPGKTTREYLRESGGFRRTADDDRVFVVLPNGSAQPLRQRFGRVASLAPPPGSTIIVPKNIDPLYGLEVARDVGTILSQFISSVATLAILATN